MSPRPLAFSALSLLVAACGGTALPDLSDGGSDAASDSATDAASDAGDASACVQSPQQGAACVPGQVTCDKVNGCCVPVLGCNSTSKKWEVLAVGCACQGVTCGPKTCSGTEMCVTHAPGIPVDGGGLTYDCVPYPNACARNWTCGCVEKNLPNGCVVNPGGCKETNTSVTLNCMGI